MSLARLSSISVARLQDNNHIQEVCTVDVIGQSEKNSMSVQHVWSRVYSVYNENVWTVRRVT